MATSNVIRFGKDGPEGNYDDLWLPVFGAEVLTAFDEFTTFRPLVRFKTMTSGNEMKFPALWKVSSEYHEAGTELLGLDVESKEYTVRLDDRPLVSHIELDDIDQAMSHFETRQELAQETAKELGRQIDFKTVCLLLNTARMKRSNSFPGGGIDQDGTPYESPDFANNDRAAALAFLRAIDATITVWDENDVPETERYAACSPRLWHQIKRLGMPETEAELQSGMKPFWGNKDIDTVNAPIAHYTPRHKALVYNDVQIFRSNRIPMTDLSEDTTHPEKYRGDFSKTRGLIWQKQATCLLQLLGIMTERERDVRRQSDFMVTKTLTGGGGLRPVCAVEVAVGDSETVI